MDPLSGAKRRLVDALARAGEATAAELSVTLGVTEAAVRQHLDTLGAAGIVTRGRARPSHGPGRPPSSWRLGDAARALFPDRHADLAVELLEALRRTGGEGAVDAALDQRAEVQRRAYRDAVATPKRASVRARVGRLAEARTADGYVAVAIHDAGGSTLVEHHCPVAAAAGSAPSLCRRELELFRDVLGPEVHVERTAHLLAGDDRCAYRITPARPRH